MTRKEINERLADHSKDYCKGIAYVLDQLDEEDKAIIRAECNMSYKQRLVPTEDTVDCSRITDLLEEYGEDNDLGEGWFWDEFDGSEVLKMI